MLAYLFTATYDDGTIYRQNEEDASLTDPARSCFFDVEQDRVVFFELEGLQHRPDYAKGISEFVPIKFGVSLVDGHFEVDGVSFRMHEEPLTGFRLIFFRRHTHTVIIGSDERRHAVVYRLGWQANAADGSNVQRVMELD